MFCCLNKHHVFYVKKVENYGLKEYLTFGLKDTNKNSLKEVFAKTERGYVPTAKNYRY